MPGKHTFHDPLRNKQTASHSFLCKSNSSIASRIQQHTPCRHPSPNMTHFAIQQASAQVNSRHDRCQLNPASLLAHNPCTQQDDSGALIEAVSELAQLLPFAPDAQRCCIAWTAITACHQIHTEKYCKHTIGTAAVALDTTIGRNAAGQRGMASQTGPTDALSSSRSQSRATRKQAKECC